MLLLGTALASSEGMFAQDSGISNKIDLTPRKKPLSKGNSIYKFFDSDGLLEFSCEAMNQKNADRKFNNFKNKRL